MGAYPVSNSPTIPGGGGQPVIPVSNLQSPTELTVLKEVQPVVTPSGNDSNWQRISNYLRPLTVTDKVIIGNATTFIGNEILRVAGNIRANNIHSGYYFLDTNTYIYKNENDDLVFVDSYAGEKTLSDLISSVVTATQINNWNTAYSWGNHASVGYLTIEQDPIFSASAAYDIVEGDITNWNTAYSIRHTHSNKSLLDTLISNGLGDQFLSNAGSYKTINVASGGNNGEVQYNDGGVFGSDPSFNFDTVDNTLNVYNVDIANDLIFNESSYIKEASSNLTFYDPTYGSTITLSTLAAGATNPWTIGTGYIEY